MFNPSFFQIQNPDIVAGSRSRYAAKALVKSVARRLGYEIHKIAPP